MTLLRPAHSLALALGMLVFAADSHAAPSAPTLAAQDGAGDALQEARGLLQVQDFTGAAEVLSALVIAEPKNGDAWYLLGYALHAAGELPEALEAHAMAASLPEQKSGAMYNAACACALMGRKDEAFDWLEKALAAGFQNTTLLQTDTDLAALRGDPRFAALVPPLEKAFVLEGDHRVLLALEGEAAGDQFGWIGRNLGDADGDGKNDILVSAPYKNVGGQNAGKIYVYSGGTGELIFERTGEPGDFLGIGIESPGDVDGDGLADVLAGASRFGGAGYALVLSGRTGELIHRVSAEEKGDNFGRKLGGTGDLDGDGHADFVVGASGSSENIPGAGRAYLFSGADGELIQVLDGEESGDAFGVACNGATIGEHKLIAIGAGNAGPGNRGRVYVYRFRDGEAQLDFVIEADQTGANLGRMFVSIVGDVDADGVPDVYASDWENNALGPSTGRIYVHSGKDGSRLHTLTGENPGDGFGIGTADVGDVDGDGHDDLLIGAWQNADGAPSGGKTYLYSGKDAALLQTYVCATPQDTFGFDATGIGDLDGDGGIDFLITAAYSHVRGPQSGRVLVIAGPPPVSRRPASD